MSIAAQYVHGMKLCVIPSHHNNHHPLALRHGPLAFVSALLLTVKIAALGFVALTPATAELSTITTERIIQLTNVERRASGVGEVTANNKLSSAALQKGQDMLSKDYFAHISPSGVTPWFWMSKVGYTYTVAGENLAIDFTSAEGVVDAWMASPTHKENLLLPEYTDIGIGVVTGEFEGGTSTIVVQMFGKPTSTAASTVQSSTSQPTASSSPTPTPLPSSTPRPTATPTITPAPAISTAPSTPAPRAPRIALASPLVSSSVELQIEGEAGSEVHILLNSKEYDVITLSNQGTAQQTISLENFPDGTLTIRAYARNSATIASALSDPIQFAKDTGLPSLKSVGVAFALSPLTDRSQVAVNLAGTDADSVVVTHDDSEYTLLPNNWQMIPTPPAAFTIQLKDSAQNAAAIPFVTLAPQFAITEDQSFPQEAMKYWQVSRRVAGSIFAVIFVLLCMAIFIRIRVQNIPLITHASLVLVLALTLFLF